jgi:L-3-cyanoalanine synthase/cysteine synthase
MASLMSFLKRTSTSSSSSSFAICQHPMMMKRLLATTATDVDSSSFSQRIRDLPKDLPGTNIKKHVSQVTFVCLFESN